jgi:hypothetical protein
MSPCDVRRATPPLAVRAGVARGLVEPAGGTPVGGWGARLVHDSVGRHSELTVTALALANASGESADGSVLIVAADIVLWPGNVASRVRDAIADRTGVAPEAIQLTASHTHSSVMMDDATIATWEHDGACAAARELVERAALNTAVHALANLRPAALTAVRRPSAVTRTRRQWIDGRLLVGVGSPVEDAFLDVVAVEGSDGNPLASIVVHGSHPTILSWGSLLFSPDYVGALRAVVEGELGSPCLFLQGCGADRAPARSFSNSVADAEAVGRALGHGAVAAVLEQREASLAIRHVRTLESGAALAIEEAERPVPQPASVRARKRAVAMPLRERNLDAARLRLSRARAAVDAGEAGASVEAARALIEHDIAERFPHGEEASIPVGVVDVGPLAFVFWPGELSGAYEALCQVSDRHGILITNANDYVNYLPTREQFAEGGYEVDASPFAASAPDRFVAAVRTILQEA